MLLVAASLPRVAAAQESYGIVVRADVPAGSGAVVAALTWTGGSLDLPLADDGNSPDILAGDGNWAASAMVGGNTVGVTLRVGDRAIPGGEVSWEGDGPRDLLLKLEGDALTAQARSKPGAPPPDMSGSATPPTAQPANAAVDGSPAELPLAPRPRGDAPGGGGSGALLLIGGGVLGLVAVGAFVLAGARRRPRIPAPLPEPGLLGPGTPSLSDGPACFVTEAAHLPALAAALLPTLARHHRVVVVADANQPVAPVPGGPVWRAPVARPRELGRLVAALREEPGAPVVTLLVAPADAAVAAALVDGAGGGGVVLVASDPAGLPGALVQAAWDGARWWFRSGAATVGATSTPEGLRVDAGP